jgi:hypothetical protein
MFMPLSMFGINVQLRYLFQNLHIILTLQSSSEDGSEIELKFETLLVL